MKNRPLGEVIKRKGQITFAISGEELVASTVISKIAQQALLRRSHIFRMI